MIHLAGWSDRNTHTHTIAQKTNAISQPTATLLNSRGRGGGSPDGRRCRPCVSRLSVTIGFTFHSRSIHETLDAWLGGSAVNSR